MSDKPSYLGLLNTVALAEINAHCYLSEWAAVTKDPDVRHVLLTVAAREGEHGMSFAKRINELGYELRQKPDENLDKKLDIVRSDCSDLEKMEALGLAEPRQLGGQAGYLRRFLQGPLDRHPDR